MRDDKTCRVITGFAQCLWLDYQEPPDLLRFFLAKMLQFFLNCTGVADTTLLKYIPHV